MDEEARRLRRIGSIRDRFLDVGGMKLYYLVIYHWQEANSTPLVRQPGKLGSRLLFSPEGCIEGYYWLSVAVWNFLLELALNLDMLVV